IEESKGPACVWYQCESIGKPSADAAKKKVLPGNPVIPDRKPAPNAFRPFVAQANAPPRGERLRSNLKTGLESDPTTLRSAAFLMSDPPAPDQNSGQPQPMFGTSHPAHY